MVVDLFLIKTRLRETLHHWKASIFSRILSFVVLGLAIALALGLPGLTQQPVVISFLMLAPETPLFEPLIAEFEAQNPDIRIQMVEGPNATNLVEDLNTSALLLGQSPYDLINLDVVWTAKFAAAGWLLDVSDRLTDEQMAGFLDSTIEAGRYEDKLFRIPWRTDVGMLYYRSDLLEAMGAAPPDSFTELFELSQTLQTETDVNWGYLWQGRQYEGLSAMFVEVLSGFGGYWIDANSLEVGLDQPESINAVRFLLDTIAARVSPPGVTTYQEEETRRLFQSGGAVFMRNWPYAVPLLDADESPVSGQVGIRPMIGTPIGEGAGCLGGWGWGIVSSTPHPEEAWRVVEFFTSEAVQRQNALAGYMPSLRSLYSDPEILAAHPYFAELFDVATNTVLRPNIAQYAQASDILQRYLSAVLSGRMQPEAAMEAAANETRNLLGRFAREPVEEVLEPVGAISPTTPSIAPPVVLSAENIA
jgi:multiple sugar transport system substrate-binding protein